MNPSDNQRANAFLITPAMLTPGIITPRTLAATPTMANGDMYISDGSAFNRLGIGSTGQVLTVSNGTPIWQSLPTTNPDPLVANALNARTTSDITITAGASKVVKLSTVVQENTTNSYIAGFYQSGWGTFDVAAGGSTGTGSVTLPVTYGTKIVSVVANVIGYTLGTVSDITSFSNGVHNIGFTQAFGAYGISTSGFSVGLKASGNAGATTHYGFSWVTFGI